MDSSQERQRNHLVMITAALPCAKPDNAGGRYVNWVTDAVSKTFDVFIIAPDGPASQRALKSGGVPRHRLLGRSGDRMESFLDRAVARLLSLAAPSLPPWRFVLGLLRDRQALDAIKRADVIDLQWEEYGVLIPMLRQFNPEALVVCTFHDVLSQRYGRASQGAASHVARMRWAWAASIARSLERNIVRAADKVVLLSQKDADLLPAGRAEVCVVTPPLAAGMELVDRSAPIPGEILFVGFLARWENEEGLLWFLADVWPRIKAAAPNARFRIAGLGVRSTTVEAARRSDVELLGFVNDLEPLYERASVVVVPVRLGAGVKFKAVDALMAGVPLVTTRVGAEGIGDPSWFTGMHDDAHEFADAVLHILQEQGEADCRSAEVRERALQVYGWDQFYDAMGQVYRPMLLARILKPTEGSL